MKTQLTRPKKIAAKLISDKCLVSTIYKELFQFKRKRRNNLIYPWKNDLNKHFSLEDPTIANKHMKRYPKPLDTTKKMEMKPTMIHHFPLLAWLVC